MRSVEDKFWSKVVKGEACWNFRGKSNKYGYGVVWLLAHRVSYELANGPIPKGLSVLHKCDNRRYVNPAHLFLGTQSENAKDMVRKGRYPLAARRGENNWQHKLTDEDVKAIRATAKLGTTRWEHRGPSFVELAGRYGVSPETISNVVHRRKWRHI